MKVKELIAALSEFNPEAQVVSECYAGYHSIQEPWLKLIEKGTNLDEKYGITGEHLCDESDIVLEDFILL
jgi:hypothetical protein